jgi:hypothetical protein
MSAFGLDKSVGMDMDTWLARNCIGINAGRRSKSYREDMSVMGLDILGVNEESSEK